MTEPARVPIAVPGLADVLADPGVLDRLPVEALVTLRRQVRVLDADLERAVSLRLLSNTENQDDVAVLTPAALARRWGISEAKVREMCRTGQVPARKSGREWLIPVARLRRWVLDDVAHPRHDPQPVRPYVIRRTQGGTTR